MRVTVEPSSAGEGGRANRLAVWLVAAAAGLFVAAGLLLWARHGDAVFNDYLVAALAWCF